MKISQLVDGYYFMVTNEQQELVRHLKEHNGVLTRHELTERHQYIAEELTRLGIINRDYDEETQTVIYKLFKK